MTFTISLEELNKHFGDPIYSIKMNKLNTFTNFNTITMFEKTNFITNETTGEAFNKFNLDKAFNEEEKKTHTLISLDTGNKYTLFLVKKTNNNDITELDYGKLLENNNNKADNYYGLKAPPTNYISFKTINNFINNLEKNILTYVLKENFLKRLNLKKNLPDYLTKFLQEQNPQSKTPSPTPS